MLIKRPSDIRSSEITDWKLYLNRRESILAAGGAAAGIVACAGSDPDVPATPPAAEGQTRPPDRRLPNVVKSPLSTTDERLNTWEQITTYNNYYEFGIDKESPSLYAGSLKTDPWSVEIEGECDKRGAMNLEDILRGETLEERVYRLRCVEAWSMVACGSRIPYQAAAGN